MRRFAGIELQRLAELGGGGDFVVREQQGIALLDVIVNQLLAHDLEGGGVLEVARDDTGGGIKGVEGRSKFTRFMVFRTAVLPPAFGPLRISARDSPSSIISFGVTPVRSAAAFDFPTSSGCRADRSRRFRPDEIDGTVPPYSVQNRARA